MKIAEYSARNAKYRISNITFLKIHKKFTNMNMQTK